jgi:hypothetical protein
VGRELTKDLLERLYKRKEGRDKKNKTTFLISENRHSYAEKGDK